MKGYRFFIPQFYEKSDTKESEYLKIGEKKQICTFQVKDPTPIDYLDKMNDKDRDLKLLCESIADDFLKNLDTVVHNIKSEDRFLFQSKPYCRKNNVTSDKSHNFCWETHQRFEGFDLYVTILRRSYVPPIADMF